MLEYDEDFREEAARLIQRRWREVSKKSPEQVTVGVEDTAQLEREKRERLLQEYRDLSAQREKLMTENFAHQRKLNHYFHEKKGQEEKHTHEQSLMEVETRYMQWLTRLRDERTELEGTQRLNEENIEEYKHRLEAQLYKANEFEAKFKEFKRDKAVKAEFSRTGKGIPAKRVQQLEEEEETCGEEVRNVRIGYLKMRNRMKKLVHQLKEKEKLTDGLHLIDFEQLKIENTTLNEKIEERNEDLLKLRKKATTTIHILTHVKEKLQFIQGENQGLKKQLAKLEEELAEHRDRLTQVKRDRDALVNDNVKMREKMPMVGAEDLLVDYEYRKKEIERLRAEVVTLKNRHHELFVWIAKNSTPEA